MGLVTNLLSSPWGIAAVAAAGVLGGCVLLRPRKKIGECCPGQSAGFLPQDVNYICKGKMQTINGIEVCVRAAQRCRRGGAPHHAHAIPRVVR